MKIYVLSFLFSFCLCIMGCKADQVSSSDKTDSQITVLIGKVDSLENLENRTEMVIKELRGKIKELNTKIEYFKEDKNENSTKYYCWLIGAVVFSILISIFVSVFIMKRGYYILQDDIEETNNRIKKYINRDMVKDNNTKLQKIETVEANLAQFESELKKLKVELTNTQELVRSQRKVGKETSKFTIPKEVMSNKVGYFGMVKGKGFFNDVYNSNQDECCFKVWYNNAETEAEFEPVNLNRIRSLDGIEKAISYIDDEVSLSDASSFCVIEKGKVTKKGDFWEVKSPVQIKLKK